MERYILFENPTCKSAKPRIKTVFAVGIILLLAISAFAAFAPTAEAITYPHAAFISLAPNPAGVGQPVAVMFWLDYPPPNAAGPLGDRWQNYKVTITRPDGSKEVKGPYTSDDAGGAYFSYTPKDTGTYKFQLDFPGQWVNTTTYQRYYEAATSKEAVLNVTADQIGGSPDNPLPTGYWTRPINAENREWYLISGNWLMAKFDTDAVAYEGSGNWNRFTVGPESAHITWTLPITFGGIIGGSYSYGMSYYTGLQYEPIMTPPIIINGVLYHNIANPPRYGFQAIDLRTGEQLWYQNSTNQLSFGQVLEFDTPNQHGGIPYLWSTTSNSLWHIYDAFTGNYILSINNVPSGLKTLGPNGELLVYTLNTAGHWFSMWNSTTAIDPTTNATWMWRPDSFRGQTVNGSRGYQWNVTGNTAPSQSSLQWYWNGVVVSHRSLTVSTQATPILIHTGFDGKTGQQLWQFNRTDMGMMTYPLYITPNEGVYAMYVRERKQWVAWDVKTGVEKWTTDPLDNDWGYYQVCGGFAYGNFYSAGYDGALHAYNAETGAHLWDFNVGSSGYDTPYGSWPLFGALVFADNKIYVGTNEHSPSTPLWRGEKLYCIDAITGKGVWNMSGMFAGGRNGLGAIADGFFLSCNGYDNQIYCFGKGQTATTISAPTDVQPLGTSVLIQGTITDQSPGAKDSPAISDQDMSDWMAYIYQQQPKPTNAAGVNVRLTAVDPNGNNQDIGNVTSDINGFYKIMWDPPIPGAYTIMATFDGSESYYESSAVTGLGVGNAPSAYAAPTSTPTQPPTATPPATGTPSPEPTQPVEPGTTTNTALYVAVAAVAVVIAIAAVALLLRKRAK